VKARAPGRSLGHHSAAAAWFLEGLLPQAHGFEGFACHRHAAPLDEAAENKADPSQDVEERGLEPLAGAPVRELVERLPGRQKAIVKLRFYLGLERREIERLLGISPRAYRREIERAFEQVAKGYEAIRQGRWCESR
jgi:DNA-directed RNA polymerase specialized sigma24 family protein